MAIPKVDAFGHVSSGLDRAPLNVYTSLADNNQPTSTSTVAHPKSVVTRENGHSGPIADIRRLSKSLRTRLHRKSDSLPNTSSDQRRFDVTILAPTLAPDSATKEDRLSEAPPEKPSLPPVKEFFTKPVETAKSIAHIHGGNDFAENLAKTDVTHGANVQVIRAYDKLVNTTTESDEELAFEDLELLKKVRQDSYVRWTLDRHVKKVGRIQAHHVPWRERKEFLRSTEGRKQAMQWREYGLQLFLFYLEQYGGHYIGASSDLPPATESALIASFERVILTSEPLQEVFLKLRRISHWEDPSESATYLVIYMILWHYDYITRAALLAVLCLTLQRRFYPPTINELRLNVERSEDTEATAHNLTQLIEQHGSHGWVEPFLEEAGPVTLSHIEDLADFLEIIRNFYEWRNPQRTTATLGMLATLCVIITFTPAWLLVKGSFFGIAFMIFVLNPIAHRYTKHRLLTSPLIWTFWKIPTHAEWAIARLQAEATQKLQTLQDRNSPGSGAKDSTAAAKQSPSSLPLETELFASADNVTTVEMEESRKFPMRIGRYHCTSENRHGNFCISTDRVSFEMHLTSKERWELRYDEMKSMQKIVGSSTIKSGDDILFTNMDGQDFQVSHLKARDEVFSQIIGYSNVRWQRTG